MAKIVLVAQELSKTTWELAKALRSQQHEVLLLTDYQQIPPEECNFQVLTYFKSWKWLEASRILPTLIAWQPNIVHVLLENEKANSALLALGLFAKAYPATILTTSLMRFEKRLKRRNPMRYMIAESDIVTCPSAESMALLRGLSTKIKTQGRAILPPVLNLSEDLRDHTSPHDDSDSLLLEKLPSEYVVLPFFEKEFSPDSLWSQRFIKIAQRYHVVFLGSQSEWSISERKLFTLWTEKNNISGRWSLTGVTQKSFKEKLLHSAQALWLAGCDLSPTELIEHYMMAIHQNCPLVLDHRQAQVHAALWRHGENAWILNGHRLLNEIDKVLKLESLQTPQKLNDSIAEQRHWIDLPLNELNRLYNKALMKI